MFGLVWTDCVCERCVVSGRFLAGSFALKVCWLAGVRFSHAYNPWIVPTFVVSLLDAIGLANTDIGTLWETADRILCSYLACTVATLLQNNMHR